MKFRVLGPMAVEDPTGRQVDLRGLRQRAVLAVLLLEAGRTVTSDYLAEMVWDGEPPQQAAGTLQAYISRLRRLLEPERDGRSRPWQLLHTVGAGYQLQVEPGALDSAEFGRLCSSVEKRPTEDAVAVLDQALALWQGEPYEEFRYFNFPRSEVHRLEERRWWAIEHRAELLLQVGRHHDVAADLASEVIAAPYRERMRGLLMLALYRSGRQADALSCYQEGRRVLVEDLGIDPGPELRRLEQAVLDQDPSLDAGHALSPPVIGPAAGATAVSSPPPVPPAPTSDADNKSLHLHGRVPLFGRPVELERVQTFVDHVVGGNGGLLLVQGDAGIGKTRLAQEASRIAADRGVELHWGHCPEMEGAPPFWPWIQILRAVFNEAEIPEQLRVDPRALPPDGRVTPETTGFVLYEAVRGLLDHLARQRPVIIVLEDLHWGDSASLRLLRFLFGPDARTGRLGVIATARQEHSVPALADLEADAPRSDAIRSLRLRPLEREAAEEMVVALNGAEVAPRTLSAVVDRSGGNPFFITELVRLGAAGVTGVPQGVRDVIRRRVERLNPSTKSMLAAAACFTGPIDLTVLSDVVAVALPDLLDGADEAIAARLVREIPERPGLLDFTHPLTRDAILSDTSRARQAYLHQELGRVLSRATGDHLDDATVAAVAHHYFEAVSVGALDEAILWNSEAAARDLNRWAPEDARQRILRTIDLARTSEARYRVAIVDLLILLGRADRMLGTDTGWSSIYDAMDLARSIEDAGRVADAAKVMTSDAWGFTTTFGRVDHRLLEHLAWALPRLETEAKDTWVGAAAVMASEAVFGENPDQASDLAAEALTVARRLDDPLVLLTALQARWVAIWGPETLPERATLVEEMQAALARSQSDPSRTLLLRWANALEQADPIAAQVVFGEMEQLLDRGRDASLSALCAWRRSLRAILDARFDDAEKLINDAYLEADRFNPQEAFDAFSGQTALLYYVSDRFAELLPILEQVVTEQPDLTPAFGPPLALALLDAGRPEDARRQLEHLGIAQLETAPQTMVRSGTTSTVAVCCAKLGDPELASAALRLLGDDRISPAVIDQMGVFFNGSRAGHRGRLLTVLERYDEAVEALERGLLVDERFGARVFAMRDRIHLAEALLRRGHSSERQRAVALAREAGSEAADLGLARDAERAGALT